MATLAASSARRPDKSFLAPIVMAYSILLHQRNNQLSALQRRLTLLVAEGGGDDTVSIYI
jgi:hypothetical protein